MTELMTQILSLREFTTPSGEIKLHDKKHMREKWGADTVPDLLNNIDEIIQQIPEHERWNLYYTAAECEYDEKNSRKFKRQNIIPFDIDGCDMSKVSNYLEIFQAVTRTNINTCVVVNSGNGIHIIVQIPEYFESDSYFELNRGHYKALCGKLNSTLYEEGLIGEFDNSAFAPRKLLRLPLTENRKKLKGVKKASIISGKLAPQPFKLSDLSDLPQLEEEDQINMRALTRLPKPDTQGVLEGCGFLKHCKENQDKVSEPMWYAMLSIVGRLEEGSKLVHEFSNKHPSYSANATDTKMQQALNASGPRTCDNIASMYKGCIDCPHYGNKKSPILIKGETYIKTKDTGFWNTKLTNEGEVKKTTPNFDDLVRYYDILHKHVVVRENELLYHWSGKYWKQQEHIDINYFAEQNMIPAPNKAQCAELVSKMKRTNLVDTRWMQVDKKVNLDNGVFEVDTMRFIPHDIKYGFSYVLPFKYKQEAECPQWTKFIKDVTLDRQELIDVLQEYMGMCLGFVDPVLVQKSAILLGVGANGKSVFLNTLKMLLGDNNYSVVPLQEATSNRTARIGLLNKLANITEETPRTSLMESSFFKDIVSGGEIEAHKMYHGPVKFKNTAKIIMACNELPEITDTTNGLQRRILLIPFDRVFSREEQDPLLVYKLREEISGIFNWAMEGLRRLEKNSWIFSEGEIIRTNFEREVEDMNPLELWAEAEVDVDSKYEGESISELFTSYVLTTGDKSMRVKTFSRMVKSLICMRLRRTKIEAYSKRYGDRICKTIPHIRLVNGGSNANY